MSGDVKREQPTRQSREQARTRLARRAVVGAAKELFVERGYSATTVEAVSALSDVPPATVYRLFASKLGILKALLDTSIAGDDEPIAVSERPNVASLLEVTDPTDLLSGFSEVTTEINERTNDVYRVLVSAADSDPGAAELLAEIERQRAQGQSQMARALARTGSLREGLREQDALDLIHALMSPDVYRLLVVDRKWRAEKYRHWLATTLAEQLT